MADMVIKLPALQSGKVLQTRIDKFGAVIKSTQQEAHDIALQTLMHYDKHGDLTLAARFLGAKIGHKPKGAKKYVITDDFEGVTGTLRKNVVAWFAKYSDLRFNGEGMIYRLNRKSATFLAHVESLGGKVVDAQAAAENPWFTLEGATRDASRNAIDLLNLIAIAESISKRINTAIEADAERGPEDTGHAYVPEQLDAMKAFAAAIEKTTDTFVKANKVNVIDLQAARVKRKAEVGQSVADTERAVTTGTNPNTEAVEPVNPAGVGVAGEPVQDEANAA